ncbi:unnamed protein product, partial [Rotaria magnacalcarata]
DESENESEFFGNFDKSPNTNKQTSPQQTTNVSLSNRSTQIEIVSSKCDMHCCNSSKPYHYVTDDELALTTIDKRSCQKWWFMDHSWLTFCKDKKKLFCHTCRDAFEREIHSSKTKFNPTYRSFIIDGFCDWKNARTIFKYHGSSKIHSDSIYGVSQQTKPTISNRKWFSLICDETCDESTLEQYCVGIRSVNDDYGIFEDVLGLYELSRQNAEAIVEVIFDILTRCGLTIFDCRGQSYDGASSMNGIYGGVSALVLKQQCKAFFVHCNSHCLDLAIHDLT